MNVQTTEKEKGFTIIEVVLVLAIAGLIFLMVFIALPALQRSQRDTQRKQDLSRAATALTSYTSNNRGALPANQAAWNNLTTGYLTANGDTYIDPSGVNYTFAAGKVPVPAFTTATSVIYYTTKASCASDGTLNNTGASRQVALQMALEGGGVACENN